MKQLNLFKSIGIILILWGIISGCESQEVKANKLIKEYLFRTLYNFKSYEPISIEIDSAFTSIYRDSAILHHAGIIRNYVEKIQSEESNMEKFMEKSKIFEGSTSSYGREQALKNMKNIAKSDSLISEYKNAIGIHVDSIKMLAANFDIKFQGWEAMHRFRSNDIEGISGLAQLLFIFDDKMSKLVSVLDLDDEDFKFAKAIIDYAIESEND